jgi:hypothetical protein
MYRSRLCVLGVILALAACLLPGSPAVAYKYHHAWQDGWQETWFTVNGVRVGPVPIERHEVEKCKLYWTGIDKVSDWGLVYTDIEGVFVCNQTGKKTATGFSTWDYDTAQGVWEMPLAEDWASFGAGPQHKNWFPGLNSDESDLFVAIDLRAWVEGGGEYEGLQSYNFADGACAELPGVFVATEALTWDPTAPEASPYGGWTTAAWLTGDAYICHEYHNPSTPELSTWALLACSGLAGLLMRRRRG